MTEMENLKISLLWPSPNNPRQRYDILPMAELVQRMATLGFLPSHPLLVTRDHEIIHGHRRYVASLVAAELSSSQTDIQRMDVDDVATIIQEMVYNTPINPDDNLSDPILVLARQLATKHNELTVPCVVDNSTEKQRALLFFDPAGEQPDLLGEARALRRAIQAGWTANDLAAYCGKGVAYINARLPLTEVDPAFARAIEDRQFSLSTAGVLAGLPSDKREAMTEFLFGMVANGRCVLTAANIMEIGHHLDAWNGFVFPLIVERQSQRNAARAAVRLWQEAFETDPHAAYVGAIRVISTVSEYKEPWKAQPVMTAWIDALAGQPAAGLYMPIMLSLLKREGRVSCNTCPLSSLPEAALKVDLAKYPCRINKSVATATGACIMGFSPNDPVDIEVPSSWPAGEMYQLKAGGTTRHVVSADDLLAAWNAAKAAQDAAEAAAKAAEAAAKKKKGKTAKKQSKPAAAPAEAAEAAATSEVSLSAPVVRSLLEKTRLAINAYRVLDQVQPSNHPMAAVCGRCKFSRPDGCEWALSSSARIVRFTEMTTDDGLLSVPFCHQYQPESWSDVIPDWTGIVPQRITRSAAIDMMKTAVATMKMSVKADSRPYQWLTGRPMNTADKYDDWFAKQLTEVSGDLRDGQIGYLWMVLASEYARAQRERFYIPVHDGSIWHQVEERRLELGVDDNE